MYAEEKRNFSEMSSVDRLDVLLACQDTLQMKMQEKIEAVLNEQDAEKQVFASVTAANIAAMNGKKETVDTEDISSCDNLSISSTGSAKHPHCLSPAGHLMRRSMHS